MKTITTFVALSLALLYSPASYADTFGSGANTFDIEFVTIGNPGNADDTTGNPNPAGKVDYSYRIGTFEISEEMFDKADDQSILDGNPLNLFHSGRGANKPATLGSWFNAAQFVNWLNTSTNRSPAYKFDISGNFQLWQPGDAGYNPNNLYRNSLARYVLPDVNEWYKAAYYDPTSDVYYDYPTGSDTGPNQVSSGTLPGSAVYGPGQNLTGPADIMLAGGLSPYGTMAQGGNVWEWEETESDLVNDLSSSLRGIRGGYWHTAADDLSVSDRSLVQSTITDGAIGFRVASIPEPSTLLIGALASIGLMLRRKGLTR